MGNHAERVNSWIQWQAAHLLNGYDEQNSQSEGFLSQTGSATDSTCSVGQKGADNRLKPQDGKELPLLQSHRSKDRLICSPYRWDNNHLPVPVKTKSSQFYDETKLMCKYSQRCLDWDRVTYLYLSAVHSTNCLTLLRVQSIRTRCDPMIKRKSNLFIRSFVKICFHVTAAEEQRGQTKSRTRVNEEHRASKNYKCFHLAFSSLGSSIQKN